MKMFYTNLNSGLFSIICSIGLLLISGDLISQSKNFDLENGAQGWQAGFAEYNVGDSIQIGLAAGHRQFDSLNNSGIYAEAFNTNGEKFYFFKQAFDSLRPDIEYFISYNIDFVTDQTVGVGIGNPPFMAKVGALNFEPQRVDSNGTYKMNFNIGSDPYEGSSYLDTLGILQHQDTGEFYNHIVNYSSIDSISVTTDSNGVFWSIISAHGFSNGESSFKIASIELEITPFDLGDGQIKAPKFSIYPNPTQNFLQVECQAPTTELRYSIANIKGKILQQGNLVKSKNRLDISRFPSGTYIFQLRTEKTISTRSFIVD